jgi:hypothetical protein
MAKKVFIILLFVSSFLFVKNMESLAADNLSSNPGESEEPAIAIDSNGVIHVVWGDDTPGNIEIYHKSSTDGGTTWTGANRLTWNPGSSRDPAIAIDSFDNVHVVWQDYTTGDYEIYYKKSTNGGSTWLATKRLTWNSSQSTDPAIAIDSSNNIHVVFDDDMFLKNEIFYKKSTNGGATWITERISWNSGYSYAATVATDSSDNIYIVWYDFSATPGSAEIFFKKSADGGATWTFRRLTWNPGGSGTPVVMVDPLDVIHVFWMDSSPGEFEIFHKKSSNGGTSWTTNRVTWNPGKSWHPDIDIDAWGNLHLVWKDDTPGNLDIYYKMSTDGGSTWATDRLSWNPGSSDNPDIAAFVEWIEEGMYLVGYVRYHVVWDDDTPLNKEIYYTNNY